MDQENEKKRRRRRRRGGRRPEQAKAAQNQITQEQAVQETVLEEPAQEENPLPNTEQAPAAPTENPALLFEDEKPDQSESPEAEEPQYRVVSVRFRPIGKAYSFDPQDLVLSAGDEVIVETNLGQEFAVVSAPVHMAPAKEIVLPLRKVLRIATDNDKKKNEENHALELRAKKTFLEKVQQHGLEMALSDVECTFDRTKLLFYFTSEGRVDFREFVKDMASIFKMRIELRQIGVRDEAKQLGGLGICGRPLCCNLFLDDFQQVSIKMAKEQNLSLNPTKISGTCGRLMCCLRYENDVYVEAAKTCPRADCPVMTPQGRGVVTESNLLCGRCRVRLDSDPENIVPFTADELKILPKGKKSPASNAKEEKPNEGDAAESDEI